MEQQKLKVGDVVRYKGTEKPLYRIVDIVNVQVEGGNECDYTLRCEDNSVKRQFGDLLIEKVDNENNGDVEKTNEQAIESHSVEHKGNYKKNKKKRK